MESWHAIKFGKYDPLCSAIEGNGWPIHFFAMEVGVQGYCASTIRSCLMHLSLTKKVLTSSLKTLSSAALSASFQIWLCQESQDGLFSILLVAVHLQLSNKQYQNQPGIVSLNIHSNRITKKYHTNNCGLFHKSTYYVNVSLQCLRTMVKFWSNFSPYTNKLLRFVAAFIKIMSLLRAF